MADGEPEARNTYFSERRIRQRVLDRRRRHDLPAWAGLLILLLLVAVVVTWPLLADSAGA